MIARRGQRFNLVPRSGSQFTCRDTCPSITSSKCLRTLRRWESGAFRPNETGRRESNHFSPACLQNSIMCNQDDDRKSLQNASNKKDRDSEMDGYGNEGSGRERERERERGGKMKRGKDKCGAIFRQVDFNGRRILITFTEWNYTGCKRARPEVVASRKRWWFFREEIVEC